jgi:hypothetical protein
MRLFKAICLTALISAVGTAAATAGEDDAILLPNLSNLTASKSHRILAAKQIHQECLRILAMVPRLSPEENEWLQGEIRARRDVENLLRRPEYAKHALYVHFYDCVVQSRLAAESLTDRERTIAWARLAARFSLTTPDDVDYWAQRAGSHELLEPVKQFAFWEYINTSEILDQVVIPYLVRSKSSN